MSKFVISEECIKLLALRMTQYPWNSSQFQKGWWPLAYSKTHIFGYREHSWKYPHHKHGCKPCSLSHVHIWTYFVCRNSSCKRFSCRLGSTVTGSPTALQDWKHPLPWLLENNLKEVLKCWSAVCVLPQAFTTVTVTLSAEWPCPIS